MNFKISRRYPRLIYRDIVKKDQIRITEDRSVCLKLCMNIQEARKVYQNRIKWRAMFFTYPSQGQQA